MMRTRRLWRKFGDWIIGGPSPADLIEERRAERATAEENEMIIKGLVSSAVFEALAHREKDLVTRAVAYIKEEEA